jgi:pullulanase/glycogen debranching enzyme
LPTADARASCDGRHSLKVHVQVPPLSKCMSKFRLSKFRPIATTCSMSPGTAPVRRVRTGRRAAACSDWTLSHRTEGRPDDVVHVALNMHWEAQGFEVPAPSPERRWHLFVNTSMPSPGRRLGTGKGTASGKSEQHPAGSTVGDHPRREARQYVTARPVPFQNPPGDHAASR